MPDFVGCPGPWPGHWLSRDLVHWARGPVAVWNGIDASSSPWRATPYDNDAIFTGSATLVNGTIKLIYPGQPCTQAPAHTHLRTVPTPR